MTLRTNGKRRREGGGKRTAIANQPGDELCRQYAATTDVAGELRARWRSELAVLRHKHGEGFDFFVCLNGTHRARSPLGKATVIPFVRTDLPDVPSYIHNAFGRGAWVPSEAAKAGFHDLRELDIYVEDMLHCLAFLPSGVWQQNAPLSRMKLTFEVLGGCAAFDKKVAEHARVLRRIEEESESMKKALRENPTTPAAPGAERFQWTVASADSLGNLARTGWSVCGEADRGPTTYYWRKPWDVEKR